ncbi:MAG: protein-export chaperone SecB [Ruminococcus sp.]|nr:protein-export chaperone SecB [Ruminococcus sp.]
MSCCELKAYTFSDINFTNRLDPNVQIKIGNKFSYNVKYPSDNSNNICRGELEVEVGDTSKDSKLNLKVTLVGILAYNPDEKRELIHTESFKILYPLARAMVTTITANAGIKPIMLPNINIDDQDIYRIDGSNPGNV